jgi:hypothetical protein
VEVCFAEAAWSPDSARVCVAVRNCYGRELIIVGYDVQRGSAVTADQVTGQLRRRIAQNYPEWAAGFSGPGGLQVPVDALEYARTDEAYHAYYKRLGRDR